MASTAALRNKVARGSIGVHVTVNWPTTKDFYFGTSVLTQLSTTEADKYSVGLESFTGVLVEGSPLTGPRLAEASWSVRNDFLVEYLTSIVDAPDAIRNVPWENADVEILAFVEASGATPWTQLTLFKGKVTQVHITERTIEMRASQPELIAFIPHDSVTANSMVYGGDPEGVRIEGAMGAAAPIVYGRCGLQAVDAAHDSSSNVWGDNRGLMLAPQLGVKVPMVPVPMVADLHSHKQGISNWHEGLMLLFSVGSTHVGLGGNAVYLPWWQENSNAAGGYSRGMTAGVAGTDPELFPCEDPLGVYSTRGGGVHFYKMGFLFTWNQQYGVAMPYSKDFSDDQRNAPYHSTELRSAAISDYTQERGTGQHTVNTGRDTRHHVWALQRVSPDFKAPVLGPEPGFFSGLLQSISIVGERLSQWTEYDGVDVGSLQYGTTSGVINPLSAIDGRHDTFAIVPLGEVLSIELPAEGPQLGDPIYLRCGIIATASSGVTMKVGFRYTPLWGLHMTTPKVRNEWNLGAFSNWEVAATMGIPGREPWHALGVWRHEDAGNSRLAWRVAQGARRPRWEWYENEPNWTPNPENFPYDVRITSPNGTLNVYAVYLECFFRPKNLEPVDEGVPRVVEGGRRADPTTGWRLSPRTIFNPFGPRKLTEGRPGPTRASTTYATGIWGVDTALNYQLGGSTNPIIEDPVSIGLHIIDHYLGQNSEVEATPGEFGSFWDAKLALDAIASDWRMTVIQPEHIQAVELLNEIGRHGMCFYQRQFDQTSGAATWRMFVDETTVSASRKWRAWAEPIAKGDVMEQSIRVVRSDLSQIVNRYTFRFGLHLPTGTFSDEHTCSADGTTFAGGDAQDYREACLFSAARYGDREATIELPWLWSKAIVEEVAKWHIDRQREPKVGIQFTVGHNMLDVEVGMFVQLDDDWADVIGQYPGMDGTGDWGSHEWLVVSKNVRYDAGQILVDLVLIEKWERPPPFIP